MLNRNDKNTKPKNDTDLLKIKLKKAKQVDSETEIKKIE
jgi:hypothetical protein